MSNFDDYDLRRGSSSRGRSVNRNVNRDYNRSSNRRSDMSLDDEIELYDYDLGSEYYDDEPANRRSASGRRPASDSRTGARRSSAGSNRSASGQRRSSASHSSYGAHSGSRAGSGKSSNRRPSSSRRGGGSRKKKTKARRTIFVIEIVLLLVLLVVFFFWNKFGKVNWDNINMDEIEVNNLDTETEEILSNYTTIALFGVDNRSNGNLDSGNSDTIMLVSINNDTKEVKMVSVQRDTYLQITEGTYRKCNYAYNHGGVETAISMLNTNLDLKISGYVAVDFNALAKVVDDLGGLDLEVTQKMINTNNPETGQNALAGYIAEGENVLKYYPNEKDYYKQSDCYFSSPGVYHMNGAQVVGYCRNRYAVDNDYGRAENQRMVVKMIVEEIKKADIGTINKIADDVFPEISTSLSLSQCISMATAAGDYEIVESSGFPFALKTTTVSKKTGSVVVPCTLATNVTQLHELLYGQEDYDPTDDTVDVISDHIVNETGFTENSAEVTQESD